MKMIHMPIPGHPEATLEGYILDCELSLGTETNRPAIVVCPAAAICIALPGKQNPLPCAMQPAVSTHLFSVTPLVGMLPASHLCRK